MKKSHLFHIGKGTVSTLDELFVEQLRDLYSAENQLIDALPQMAAAAHDAALKHSFLSHLEETKGHVERLESIFDGLEEDPDGKTCQAMKGLIKEGKEVISEDATPEVRDAALIAAAQRVEHYEIAGYGTVRTYAEILGNTEAEELLQATLGEESMANNNLTAAAGTINFKIPIGNR